MQAKLHQLWKVEENRESGGGEAKVSWSNDTKKSSEVKPRECLFDLAQM